MNFSSFMHDYPWVFGIIMILGGPIVALYGRRFFPWVIAGIVSISFLLLFMILSSAVGLMSSNIGLILSIGFGGLFSVIIAFFVMRTVWVAVGLLGIIGGFFLGSMIYTIILAYY